DASAGGRAPRAGPVASRDARARETRDPASGRRRRVAPADDAGPARSGRIAPADDADRVTDRGAEDDRRGPTTGRGGRLDGAREPDAEPRRGRRAPPPAAHARVRCDARPRAARRRHVVPGAGGTFHERRSGERGHAPSPRAGRRDARVRRLRMTTAGRTLRAGAVWPARDDLAALARQGNLIPIYREILADLDTPVSAFLKIHRGSYGFLLESVEGGEKWARYSFLGTEPARVFRCRDRTVEIERPGLPPERRTVDDPLDALRQLLAEYRLVAVPGLPRFAGGLVGCVGYDMARTFERLPTRTTDDLGLPDACLMLAESLLVFDNVAQKIKVVSHVHLRDGESADAAYDAAVARIDALVARLAAAPAEPERIEAVPGAVRSNVTQAEYEANVRRAKEYIRAGDVIQVVLAQRFELPLAA